MAEAEGKAVRPRRRGPVLRAVGLVLLALLLFLVWLAATPLPRPRPAFDRPIWIGPVDVIDQVTATVIPGQAIAIHRGRIERVVPAANLNPRTQQAMVAPGGRFVVPGLWDMHALLTRYAPSLEQPLYLAHGVTRVRNILDCPGEGSVNLHPCASQKARWNTGIALGSMAGPIVVGSGTFPVGGADRLHRDSNPVYAAATPQQARALVRRFADTRGARDHIKTYDGLPRGIFFALMDEARKAGVEVSGHIPAAVSVAEAASAGFKAIAHARALPIGCSTREAEIMRLRSAGAPGSQWMKLALDHYDPERCSALLALLREKGTYISPTLVTRYSETRAGMAEMSSDPAVLAASPGVFELIWREDIAAIDARTPEEEKLYAAFYAAAAERTADASRAGVKLLLGSDTGDAYVAPGLGLMKEMELWRRAGIAPAAILRAATSDAAAYFGLESRIGRVAPGQVADLVFLGADPLRDPAALKRPAAVLQGGRLYRRLALDQAEKEAQATASSWRFTIHFLRDFLRNPLGFTG